METGLQLGSLLLYIGSQMRDLTLCNKDPSYKPVSIFETVIECHARSKKKNFNKKFIEAMNIYPTLQWIRSSFNLNQFLILISIESIGLSITL